MKKFTFTDGGYTFQRIDKKAARRAYNNGLRVMLCILIFPFVVFADLLKMNK